jgi:hypothetical protein
MVGFDKVVCMYLVSWFPGVIHWGITLPLYLILQGLFAPKFMYPYNVLHFPLLFSIDKVRWRLREVFTVFWTFMIW